MQLVLRAANHVLAKIVVVQRRAIRVAAEDAALLRIPHAVQRHIRRSRDTVHPSRRLRVGGALRLEHEHVVRRAEDAVVGGRAPDDKIVVSVPVTDASGVRVDVAVAGVECRNAANLDGRVVRPDGTEARTDGIVRPECHGEDGGAEGGSDSAAADGRVDVGEAVRVVETDDVGDVRRAGPLRNRSWRIRVRLAGPRDGEVVILEIWVPRRVEKEGAARAVEGGTAREAADAPVALP